MTADTVSSKLIETVRKNTVLIEGKILRRLADVTQAYAANFMGVCASTVSRMSEDIGMGAQLLTVISLQMATVDSMVVNRNGLFVFKRMAYRYLKADLEGHQRGGTL